MDKESRARDILRARVSKALMDGAESVLDQRINGKAELLIALNECIKILRGFQKKIEEEFWEERRGKNRLLRPPPSQIKNTPIPAPPPTKGRRR